MSSVWPFPGPFSLEMTLPKEVSNCCAGKLQTCGQQCPGVPGRADDCAVPTGRAVYPGPPLHGDTAAYPGWGRAGGGLWHGKWSQSSSCGDVCLSPWLHRWLMPGRKLSSHAIPHFLGPSSVSGFFWPLSINVAQAFPLPIIQVCWARCSIFSRWPSGIQNVPKASQRFTIQRRPWALHK